MLAGAGVDEELDIWSETGKNGVVKALILVDNYRRHCNGGDATALHSLMRTE